MQDFYHSHNLNDAQRGREICFSTELVRAPRVECTSSNSKFRTWKKCSQNGERVSCVLENVPGKRLPIVGTWKRVKLLSHVRLSAIRWTVAYQASQSMGFSRQEYWSGVPFPSPGDLPDPRIEPRASELQADALPSEPPGSPNSTYTKQFKV